MNIKNYTSEIPATTSMGRIERYLVSAGASDISKSYESGVCVSIKFRMVVNATPLFFELPAKIDACFNILWKEVKRPRSDTKQKTREQAERTAWKIICDWVEVQITMIKLEQAEPLQIFLPYVYNPAKEKTFYQQIKDTNYKALLAN